MEENELQELMTNLEADRRSKKEQDDFTKWSRTVTYELEDGETFSIEG